MPYDLRRNDKGEVVLISKREAEEALWEDEAIMLSPFAWDICRALNSTLTPVPESIHSNDL